MTEPWPFVTSSTARRVCFDNSFCLRGRETDRRLELITVTDNQDEWGGGREATGVRIPAACRRRVNQFGALARSVAYWTHRLTLLKMAVTSKPNTDLWLLTICRLLGKKTSRTVERKAPQCWVFFFLPFLFFFFWQGNCICGDKGIKYSNYKAIV